MLTDIRYFPNLLHKSPVIRTFNRDGSGFIIILLKFVGLFDVIAIDRYLSNITKKISLSSYLNTSFGWRYILLALEKRIQNRPNNPRVHDNTVSCFKQYQYSTHKIISIGYPQFCSEVFYSADI